MSEDVEVETGHLEGARASCRTPSGLDNLSTADADIILERHGHVCTGTYSITVELCTTPYVVRIFKASRHVISVRCPGSPGVT